MVPDLQRSVASPGWPSMGLLRVLMSSVAIGTCSSVLATGHQQQPLRTGVEVVVIDAQVVDREGNPVETLTPADFDVTIDGKRRKVASAVLVHYETSRDARPGSGSREPPAGERRGS